VVRHRLPQGRRDLAGDHHAHGAAALASHLLAGARLDLPVTALPAGSTAVGAVAGTLIGDRLPQHQLGRAFAVVMGVVAVFLLVDVLALGGPPDS
jgi:uncharacterized membrane protein YfcA